MSNSKLRTRFLQLYPQKNRVVIPPHSAASGHSFLHLSTPDLCHESFFGSGARTKSTGSVAMSSSTPISFVRAWCLSFPKVHRRSLGQMGSRAFPRGFRLNIWIQFASSSKFGFAILPQLACERLVVLVRPPEWRHACTERSHKSHPVRKAIYAVDVVVSQPSCLTAD